MAKGKFVSNRDESVRMFDNPILEYFSHIHPATPIVVFVPIIVFTAYLATQQLGLVEWILALFGGILLWTIIEYTLHRWAFHYEPKSKWGKRLHFLVHGVHHDYPRDSTRLVMPLLVSLPLSTAFYLSYMAIFGDYHNAVFAGFSIGYVAYDSIHYATHHWPMKGRIGKFLRVYHMRHHYEDEHTAYGVSNPLWDFIFRTTPSYLKKESSNK